MHGENTESRKTPDRDGAVAFKRRAPERLVLLGGHVTESVRARFVEMGRREGKSCAAYLREMVAVVIGDPPPEGPVAPGSARKVTIRLRGEPRRELLAQAASQHTSPAAWATALLEAALSGTDRPVWGKREAEELRALYLDLKRIELASSDPAVLDAIRPAMLRVARNIGRLETKSR